MLKISDRTYMSFEASARRDFCRRLILAIRQVFDVETQPISDAELAELSNVAMDRAERYELDLEYSVWALYAAMFVFGKDFDTSEQHEWSRDVLLDQNLAEDAAVGLLGLRIYMATGRTI